jgi:hypothetical protein
MTDSNQNNLQLNIDYHVSTVSTQVHDDLISTMQYYLYCVDVCLPDRPIPPLFIDYHNNIFPRDQFANLVKYFIDYPTFKMLDSGLFWESNLAQGNEFLDINEGTDIEKLLLKYGIKAEKSKIQELRKLFKEIDILTIMIASPIWYENNFFKPVDFLAEKSKHVCCSSCACRPSWTFSRITWLYLFIYIILGILAITGFAFSCMGFKNEQAKAIPEWESMPLVCISFSISEFIVIVIMIILIIKRIKKWILIIIGIVLLALCVSFFYVYNDRFQKDSSSQNCATNSVGACGQDQTLSDGIKNYTISMMLGSAMLILGYVFLIVLLVLDCCCCMACFYC